MKSSIAALLIALTLSPCVKADWQQLVSNIRNTSFTAAEVTGVPVEAWITCDDKVERPYLYVIPESYEPAKPVPMLVYLHGLSARKNLIEDRVAYVNKNPLLKLATDMGWIIVFPFSQRESNWFNDVGINKVNDIVVSMKQQFNVDDDRVWIGGFSDGGSGSMGISMLKPDNFAAFMSLSGQMGVTAQWGKKHLYPSNMASSKQYVVNTDLDRLYPAKEMRKTVKLANEAGANIEYSEHYGITHKFTYADVEMPNFRSFLSSSVRDTSPSTLTWTTATSQYGTRLWLSIDGIADTDPATWHVEHNMIITDERVYMGIEPDWEYKKPGVYVIEISDGNSFAGRIGVRAGDVLVRANDTNLDSLDDLFKFLGGIKPEGHARITVRRGDRTIELLGKLNPLERYELFPTSKPSGMIKAEYDNNTFNVETSRVKAFSIRINPDMVDMESDVKVIWNGKTVHHAPIKPDTNMIKQIYQDTADRKMLYAARLSFSQ